MADAEDSPELARRKARNRRAVIRARRDDITIAKALRIEEQADRDREAQGNDRLN